MSKDAVVVVIALCLGAGWYGRHFVQASADVKAAKGRLAGARKVRWAAVKVALFVGLAVYVAGRWWIDRHGG